MAVNDYVHMCVYLFCNILAFIDIQRLTIALIIFQIYTSDYDDDYRDENDQKHLENLKFIFSQIIVMDIFNQKYIIS